MKEKPGLNHKNQFRLMVIVSQVAVYRCNERERDWRRGVDATEGRGKRNGGGRMRKMEEEGGRDEEGGGKKRGTKREGERRDERRGKGKKGKTKR
jgi:hypothetical protein